MTGNHTSARSGPRPGHASSPQAWLSAQPAADRRDRPAEEEEAPAGRIGKSRSFAAAGAAAAAVPAVPGLAFAASGHPGAIPLLIFSGVIGVVSVIAGAVVKIYDCAQRTRRLRIRHEGTTAIAEAIARCIDDTHAAAREVPAGQQAAEAASVRASAVQVVTEIMPAMLAVIGRQEPAADDLDVRAPSREYLPGPQNSRGKTV